MPHDHSSRLRLDPASSVHRHAAHRSHGRLLTAVPVFAVSAVMLLAAVAFAGFEENFSTSAERLTIANLTGEVIIEGHAGTAFEIEVLVRGDDGTRDNVEVRLTEGEHAELVVVLPFDESGRYVYPEMGRGSRAEISMSDRRRDSLLARTLGDMGRRSVRVSGDGRGFEIWADMTIRVPAGKRLNVELGVGPVESRGVHSDLNIDVASGRVEVSDQHGDLAIDTGSGHVIADGVEGRLTIDTGSGHVELSAVTGYEIEVDTGSGHVRGDDLRVEELSIDTGSGHVELDDIECRSAAIDTGSGHVSFDGAITEGAEIDTGSGSVRLSLSAMGSGEYVVDAGSGSITLDMPALASARVEAETSSGGIDVDVDAPDYLVRERDEVEFEVGDGDALVQLETGSGRVRIRQGR